MSSITQTILEQFREREKEIKKECERLDKEMDKKRQGSEKIQQEKLAELTKARADLDVMKTDYKQLESELENQAKADIEATAITAEKVKAGTASMNEFIRAGLSPDAIKMKAREETRAKLAAAVEIIRAKAAEIFQLELEEAEARQNLIYCMTYPGQTQIKKLRAEIETLERGITAVSNGYPKASADVGAARNNVSLCEEKSIGSLTWDSLTYDELRDLRLDPRIRDRNNFKALEILEGIIADAKPGDRYSLVMSAGGWGPAPGFSLQQLDQDSGLISTTTMTAPVKK
jgi:uncharacterized phage infection (PIP) family protein YhgE